MLRRSCQRFRTCIRTLFLPDRALHPPPQAESQPLREQGSQHEPVCPDAPLSLSREASQLRIEFSGWEYQVMTSHYLLPIRPSAPRLPPTVSLGQQADGFSVTASSVLLGPSLIQNYDFLLLVRFLIKWDKINFRSPLPLTMPTSPADCLAAKLSLEYQRGLVNCPVIPLTVPRFSRGWWGMARRGLLFGESEKSSNGLKILSDYPDLIKKRGFFSFQFAISKRQLCIPTIFV